MNVYTTEQLDLLEKEIIEFLEQRAEKAGVSNAEWGRRAFGQEITKTQVKIQTILGKCGEKRQLKKLPFRDFIRLCQALGLDSSKVLASVMLDK